MTRIDPSRRSVLKAAAAFGTVTALGGLSVAQDDDTETDDSELPDDVTLIRLGGATEAWQGREPEAIADEENPTLELVAGQTYVVEWENVDDQPHNFAIYDSNGENLPSIQPLQNNTTADEVSYENVTAGDDDDDDADDGGSGAGQQLEATETIQGEGQVQTLQFTASEEMNQYICEVHPNTMVGDIEIVEEGGLGSDGGGSGSGDDDADDGGSDD